MKISRCLLLTATVLCSFCLLQSAPAARGQTVAATNPVSLDRVTSAKALPNGMEIRDGSARIQITALRDDVLRIRVSRTQTLPEDASWAVLASARTSTAPVK